MYKWLVGVGRGWWVDVNLKGYLSSQQSQKLTETNLCKKKSYCGGLNY